MTAVGRPGTAAGDPFDAAIRAPTGPVGAIAAVGARAPAGDPTGVDGLGVGCAFPEAVGAELLAPGPVPPPEGCPAGGLPLRATAAGRLGVSRARS